MTRSLVHRSSSRLAGGGGVESRIVYPRPKQPQGSPADLPTDRRATIRIFIIDANLNVVSASLPQATLPPQLRPIVVRLVGQCRENGATATSFCQNRIVRVVPMLGSPTRYVVSVERYMPLSNLLRALKRYRLSPRELDVLMLALDGKTASETAECLDIAISTTSDHLNRLLSKTGTRNKSSLIAKVLGWDICRSSESGETAPIVNHKTSKSK